MTNKKINAMYVRKLRTLNQLVAKHIEQFGTREDFKILLEISEYQNTDSCLTLKQLALSTEVPESTLKRRLARLVRLRFVAKKTSSGDHRVHHYSLSEKTMNALTELAKSVRAYRWD